MNHVSVYNITNVNSSFAEGTLDVMYTGGNRNGSHFSKEDVEKALPSLYNVPIVAHWMPEDDTIGGHDIEVVKDKGDIKLRKLTEPCGVVPEHAVFSFNEKEDSSGEIHEYLTIDGVLLWKRQDVYEHIESDLGGVVKHSMEVDVRDGYEGKDGFYHITDFEFTALCLLEDCEPCFEGSKLTLFSVQNFKEKMDMMMRDLEETIFEINHKNDDTKKCSMNQPEGGEQLKKNEKELLAEKYSIDVDKLDFDINEFSLEELEEKFKAAKEEGFKLQSEVRKELSNAVKAIETVDTDWGGYARYWFVDYNSEDQEVFVEDSDDFKLYGFKYTPNGDAFVIDVESKKRKKYEIVDFQEGEEVPDDELAAGGFELKQCLDNAAEGKEKLADAEKKYAELKEAADQYEKDSEATIQELNNTIEALKQYKAQNEKDIADAARQAVLDEFSDLAEIEEFVELSNNCEDLAPEALKEKCFAIRGKNVQVNFSVNQPSTKIAVEHKEHKETSRYGDLFERFGDK